MSFLVVPFFEICLTVPPNGLPCLFSPLFFLPFALSSRLWGETPFLVMDYAPGGSVRKRPRDAQRALVESSEQA